MTEVVSEEPAAPADAGRVARSRASTIRAVAYLVVAVIAVVVAVLFAAHGVRIDTFPAYVKGDTETHIKQFSGPWITGAFGLLALAGLLIVAAVGDLRPPGRPAAAATLDTEPEVGEAVSGATAAEEAAAGPTLSATD